MNVGKSVARVDAFDKATGRAKYTDDLCDRRALVTQIVRSTVAHGIVKSVDISAAEKIPGVVRIFTCFDVPDIPYPTAGHPWSVEAAHQDVADRHLLSLRDMNRTEQLEEMMDAGVRSFKIEGRLKDAGYVKNVTAWYRQRIDEILKRRADEYVRASQGKSRLTFQPDVQRSFNRGFTDYFLQGRTPQPIHAFHSPKATGPKVGWVKRTERQRFVFEPLSPATPPLVAGDGL